MGILQKIEDRLVDDWRRSWRWASMRLGAIASLALGYLAWLLEHAPDAITGALNSLPPEIRSTLPVWLPMVAFATLAAARLVTKKKADG